MKFSLFLAFLVGSTLVVASDYKFNSTLDKEWENWKLQYSKQYKEDEENYRRMIWESALSYIEQHNQEYSMGKHTFTVAMNQFGDLTNEEFNRLMNGFVMNESENSTEEEVEEYDGFDDDNEKDSRHQRSINWVTKGFVTAVKNQGNCGSCWAFSATGAIEGQWKKKRNKLISLSEQNLLDCDTISKGCNGGFMAHAFKCVIDKEGINSEKTYPYTARKRICRFQKRKVAATITNYKRIHSNEISLARKVADVGPISVAINAGLSSFMYYSSGVYFDNNCNSMPVNHAVLLVGYGRSHRKEYWLVKNSWGTSWGKRGYIKMAKDRNNHCGIATYALYPIV